MKYNVLGRTGLYVSQICLGTMTYGGSEGIWGLIGKMDQSEQLLGRALQDLKVKRDEREQLNTVSAQPAE